MQSATDGYVKRYDMPFRRELTLAATSVLYCDAKWESAINDAGKGSFHLADGRVEQVSMMRQSGRLEYRKLTNCEVVVIEFYWGMLDWNAYIVLPATNSSPEQFLAEFDGSRWKDTFMDWWSSPVKRRANVVLPTCINSLDCAADLTPTLVAMGMRTAFSNADFSGVSAKVSRIGLIEQRSILKVGEQISENEQRSESPVEESGNEPLETVQLVADRPFLFFVQSKGRQTILLMGLVRQPSTTNTNQ
jgi:serpin B